MQIGIRDDVSIWNALSVPILLRDSRYLSSVTKLWDMIVCVCMSNGRIGHANVLDCKFCWLTSNERDMVLPSTI